VTARPHFGLHAGQQQQQQMAVAAAAGTLVEARYEDGEWYAATVVQSDGTTWRVSFDGFEGEHDVHEPALRARPGSASTGSAISSGGAGGAGSSSASAAGPSWGPCRFGDACTREGCRYSHPQPEAQSGERRRSG
jgi:hypothetical protein